MVLLKAVALVCLILSVNASSSGGAGGSFSYELSGAELTRLYNSPVYKGEWMVRPLGSGSIIAGPISHTGIRVTLGDGSQWLIHKGDNYGINSQTVITSASNMSDRWRNVHFKTIWTREFNGRKKVSDFIKTGGASYNLLFNCHVASIRMILQ